MINSKWSYMTSGVNIMVALYGALIHSGVLLFMGAFFAVWNYYTAEYNRSKEDEKIRAESSSTTDTETED